MQQAKEESLYYESGNFRLQALDDGEAVEVEVERLMGFYRDFVEDGASFDEARVRALTNSRTQTLPAETECCGRCAGYIIGAYRRAATGQGRDWRDFMYTMITRKHVS